MKRTLKVLSALLNYPTAELQAAVPEMRAALDAERRLPQKNRDRVDRLLEEVATRDLYDLQERYVLLFDRTRSLSLNLFEHVHGESRDRGQAMVDLMALYERHGLAMAGNELPDHSAAVPGVPLRDSRGGGPRPARGDRPYPGGHPAAAQEAQGPVLVGVLLRPGAGRREAADRGRGDPSDGGRREPGGSGGARRGLGGGRSDLRPRRRRRNAARMA